ncbi:MAG: hypothetical protein ABEJ42_09915 [Halobacteriaceae archaeon]
MYGVVTRNAPELEWEGFDRAVYEVKAPTGRTAEPEAAGASAVSCFGDTATVEVRPELAQRDAAGRPATRERADFGWSSVCPTEPDYRAGVLETVADAAAASGDVRLDDVGFAGPAYCRCDRCDRLAAESDHDDRTAWRAATVSAFVADAAERVPGRLSLSVHPDPYPGHLRRHGGVDLAAVADDVDEVVVPLYDAHYDTTYWLDTLAAGFADRTDDLGLELGVELYAADVDLDRLEAAAATVEPHADVTYFGYGADAGRAVLRRRAAAAGEGVEHGP